MSSLKYWIWLATRQGASPVRTLRVLEQFGSPERAYFADPGEDGMLADIPDKLRAALTNPWRRPSVFWANVSGWGCGC